MSEGIDFDIRNASSLKRCAAFVYFVCSTREQAQEMGERLVEYSASIGFDACEVFFDRSGEPPHVLVNLLDICRDLPQSVIVAESRSSFASSQVNPQAIMHFASSHGIRIVFKSKDDGGSETIGKSATRYLKYISNYYGRGILNDKASSVPSVPEYRLGSIGRLPLGYCAVNSKVEISPRSAEAVQEIFKLFSRGISVREIEKRVKESFADIRCPTRNQIYFIIDNSRYIGCDDNGVALPPIIENRLWLDVRAEACRRGLAPKEHLFLLKNLFYKDVGRMRPSAYCRSIHAPAYVIESAGKSICIDAEEIEALVLKCAERMLASDLDAVAGMCMSAAKQAAHFKNELLETFEKRTALIDSFTKPISDITSMKTMVKGLDLMRIEMRLSELNEEYERYYLELLSKTDAEIDEFFHRMRQLGSLCAEEKRYFLNILIKEITVCSDEICICCFSTKIKRIHTQPKFRMILSGQ